MQLDKLYWKSFIESKGSNPATIDFYLLLIILSKTLHFYFLDVNLIQSKYIRKYCCFFVQ